MHAFLRHGRALAAVLLVAGSAATARGQSLDLRPPVDHHRLVWLAAGTALVGSFLVDDYTHEEMFTEGHDDARGLAAVGNALGTPMVLAPSFGGIYLAGRLFDRPDLSDGAVDGVLALAAASAATQVLKIAVGRPRPSVAVADGDELRPFTLDTAYHSFPSGHATAAFSVATTIAMETDNPWLASAAYAAAGATAWARVHDNRHWLSDTAAGALVGTFVTRYTIHRLRDGRLGTDGAWLDVGAGGVALTLSVP